MHHVEKVPHKRVKSWFLTSIATFAIVCSLVSVTVFPNQFLATLSSSRIASNLQGPKCIRMRRGDSREGIGAIVKRYELGFAIAEVYGAELDLPVKESEHGYNVSEMFSSCEATTACEVNQERFIVDTCERGDCPCFAENILSSFHHVLQGCRSLTINADGARHMEYSGCYNKTLARYFNTDVPLLNDEYAAVHYRQGDLEHVNGGKSLSNLELQGVIKFLCSATDFVIVLVTEGDPRVPICKDRMFIANDSSVLESMNIFKHAQAIGVSTSSYSRLIAQRTLAKRFIAPERGIGLYTWARDVKWTIFSKDGGTHHYANTRDAELAASSPGGFKSGSYQTINSVRLLPLGSIYESWRKLK